MVLYYSKHQKTKVFAQAIGQYIDAPVAEVTSKLNHKSTLGFLFTAISSAFTGKEYPIDNLDALKAKLAPPPAEVYLCSPIWGGQMAAPVKYFLRHAPLKDVKVHVVLTASVPTVKYQMAAAKFLSLVSTTGRFIPGHVYVFAASNKVKPQAEVLLQQLPQLLKTDETNENDANNANN